MSVDELAVTPELALLRSEHVSALLLLTDPDDPRWYLTAGSEPFVTRDRRHALEAFERLSEIIDEAAGGGGYDDER